MSDIKEVIGKVNGMPVLKDNTIVALQKDIRELKNLMRSIEGRMQDKKAEIKEKDLPPVVSANEEAEVHLKFKCRKKLLFLITRR